MEEDRFDIDYNPFKKEVRSLLGIDLDQYKPAQMKRRIRSFILKYKCETLVEFVSHLRSNPKALLDFKDFLTINVTEFFRNPERFLDLQVNILPNLIPEARKQGRPFRIWSAGCSNGSEAYTMAIIMDDSFPGQDYSITATDIDETVMKLASEGEFREIDIKNLSKELLAKHFDQNLDEQRWKIKSRLKRNVRFSRNNLLEDTFSKGFDLILCRNVVIYFTEEAKDMLYQKFFDALTVGGVLFIGGTETILNSKQVGFTRHSNLFYYK